MTERVPSERAGKPVRRQYRFRLPGARVFLSAQRFLRVSRQLPGSAVRCGCSFSTVAFRWRREPHLLSVADLSFAPLSSDMHMATSCDAVARLRRDNRCGRSCAPRSARSAQRPYSFRLPPQSTRSECPRPFSYALVQAGHRALLVQCHDGLGCGLPPAVSTSSRLLISKTESCRSVSCPPSYLDAIPLSKCARKSTLSGNGGAAAQTRIAGVLQETDGKVVRRRRLPRTWTRWERRWLGCAGRAARGASASVCSLRGRATSKLPALRHEVFCVHFRKLAALKSAGQRLSNIARAVGVDEFKKMGRWRKIAGLPESEEQPWANSIAYAKNYTAVLDEIYKRATYSTCFNSLRRMARAWRNAKGIMVSKIEVTGLGD